MASYTIRPMGQLFVPQNMELIRSPDSLTSTSSLAANLSVDKLQTSGIFHGLRQANVCCLAYDFSSGRDLASQDPMDKEPIFCYRGKKKQIKQISIVLIDD